MSGHVFVTGGNGFIGRHVVSEVLDAGSSPKVLLSRPDPTFMDRFPRAVVLTGDLLDGDVLAAGMRGASAVIHLAAKNIDHDGRGFERVNVDGTRQVARHAIAAGVRRLIYVSSVGVYGHGSHRLADESTPVRPDTPFSRSKAAAERVLLEQHRQGHLDVAILRHRFVYGEGDRAVVPRLIKAAKKYPFWISRGRAKMSLIWAADLAKIMRRLGDGDGALDAAEPVYHVTDGQPISYRDVITELCAAFGGQPPRWSIPLPLLYGPVRLRERLLGIDPERSKTAITSLRLKLVAQDNVFSNAKLMALLPDLTLTPFRRGLTASLDYYRGLQAEPPTGLGERES